MSPFLPTTPLNHAGPTMTRGAAPPYSIPWLLVFLRRWARVSACSPLTAATPTGRSLGSDRSRGAGDYTPRDKPICAIRVSPVYPPTQISRSEAGHEYCFSCGPSTLEDNFSVRRKWMWMPFRLFPALFSSLLHNPCLWAPDSILLGLVTFSRVPLTLIRIPSN
jgi:hypothetical protein